MAGIKQKDNPELSSFMTDFWAYIKAFYIPEDSGAYWDALTDQGTALMKKYSHLEIASALVPPYIEQKDKEWRRHSGKTEAHPGAHRALCENSASKG